VRRSSRSGAPTAQRSKAAVACVAEKQHAGAAALQRAAATRGGGVRPANARDDGAAACDEKGVGGERRQC
jgi:hypothetical protein